MKYQQISKAFLPIHQVSLGNKYNNYTLIYIIVTHTNIFRAKWARYNGTTLKKDYTIITCIKDSEPQFGWINDIIISEEQKIILEIVECSIICYANHYHSWVVEKTDQKCCLLCNEFTTQQVLIPRHANINTYFITLKYAVL